MTLIRAMDFHSDGGSVDLVHLLDNWGIRVLELGRNCRFEFDLNSIWLTKISWDL